MGAAYMDRISTASIQTVKTMDTNHTHLKSMELTHSAFLVHLEAWHYQAQFNPVATLILAIPLISLFK
jgi:hypothetical protein